LQLVDTPQALQPRMVEQVLLRCAIPVEAFRDLDVAVDWIGHQVHGVVLAR
jgi:hypothetical protein